jgi:hypothetical protein
MKMLRQQREGWWAQGHLAGNASGLHEAHTRRWELLMKLWCEQGEGW